MSNKFSIIPIQQLLSIILKQEKKGEIFGIPQELFFVPKNTDIFRIKHYGQLLETPIGVAAGPHTQMAQNIIAAWLCGARFIELKTIQTLDELDVSKPCIDMQDQGFNCEWSQELKIKESYDQYLNAWIIIHILRDKFSWDKNIGTIFNMSIGYDFNGILKDNVQWFFDKMQNCKTEKQEKIKDIKNIYPNIVNINIPDCISNNVTLSTMHGCPTDEIEKIGLYLIENKKLHTTIKLNPTLLGSDKIRDILNNKLGFETKVPDTAFEHDLKYDDAVHIIKTLKKAAEKNNVNFYVKLTNTLECINNKDIFSKDEKMMYMSGRALHPISINLARKLQNDFDGKIDISFSGGADCFNTPEILGCGLKPVTVCSDLLKPGGYTRLKQYTDEINTQFDNLKSRNIDDFILNKCKTKYLSIKKAALINLNNYADKVIENEAYKKQGFNEPSIKTKRKLDYFDCIKAPCVETCPTHQEVPEYMYYSSRGEFDKAFQVIIRTNPLPLVTGMVCEHPCQTKCTRINYDNSLLIREIKHFIAENKYDDFIPNRSAKNGLKVAIIGAGPSGLSCAFFLAQAGFDVEIYEKREKPGGMVSAAIPSFRITDKAINKDIKRIENLGVNIHYNLKIHKSEFESLLKNKDFVYIATGAQSSKKIDIQGINSKGVIDALNFLYDVRNNKKIHLGKNIAIIGGGNTAIDAARTANLLVRNKGKVTIVYRRTKKEMPAEFEEIQLAIKEGIKILELSAPEKIISEKGKVKYLLCCKTILSGKDKTGRAKPVKIKNSEFKLQFDTIIPALGQDIDIDFIDNKLLKHNPLSFETKIKNLYIGGDAVAKGSTIINAIADGRKVAENIIKSSNIKYNFKIRHVNKKLSIKELKIKKAKRIYGVNIQENKLFAINNFNSVKSILNEQQAKAEASRCLFCDEICNTCVTVCPNLANYSYETKPVKYKLKKAVRKNSKIIFEDDETFSIKQKYQVLNIGDWCNECGNCTTFCPTKGAPYKDKPKFYLTEKSFNEYENGYFIKKENSRLTLIHKINNENKILSLMNNTYFYETKNIIAKFDKKNNFKLIDVKFKNNNLRKVSFKEAAEMSILLDGAKDLYI